MDTKFIAEVSSNHHQNLNRCLQFIDTAADIGCDAIKFQLFKINELFSKEILEKSEIHRSRKDWELPLAFLPHLSNRCRDRKLQFGCTPFYLDAVNELLPFVDFYKIASYELLWNDLLIACAQTGKPLILSTGMATIEEIKQAVTVVQNSGCNNLAVLHCISGYPAPVSECNLAAMETVRSFIQAHSPELHCSFGWSDHSVNPGVIYRAVHKWDAELIEFHLDLEGKGAEYKSNHCWLPDQIRSVISDVRHGFNADGSGKKEPSPSELPDRDWRADPEDGLRPFKHVRKIF